uniref:Mitochondrial import inner membrane translocase subunit n=1 Tax=Oryza glaberrima TaxID=4538 RepID=I1NUX7_ORYGL
SDITTVGILHLCNTDYMWKTEKRVLHKTCQFMTVGSKCFAKCVTKPGSSLSGSESSCISRCVDHYIEATGIFSRALFSTTR